MQEMVDEQGSAWDGVYPVIVNLPGYESGLADLSAETDIPILQDTTEADAGEAYGAYKWYIYIVDQDGYLTDLWYQLDLDGDERQRVYDAVDSVLEGA